MTQQVAIAVMFVALAGLPLCLRACACTCARGRVPASAALAFVGAHGRARLSAQGAHARTCVLRGRVTHRHVHLGMIRALGSNTTGHTADAQACRMHARPQTRSRVCATPRGIRTTASRVHSRFRELVQASFQLSRTSGGFCNRQSPRASRGRRACAAATGPVTGRRLLITARPTAQHPA